MLEVRGFQWKGMHPMVMQLVHQSGPVVQQNRLIRLPSVEGLTGLKKSSIYALMRKPLQEGGFPRPVPLSGRMVAWSENAVLTWVNARIADAEAQQ